MLNWNSCRVDKDSKMLCFCIAMQSNFEMNSVLLTPTSCHWSLLPEAYSEPCQIIKMDCFAKTVYDKNLIGL